MLFNVLAEHTVTELVDVLENLALQFSNRLIDILHFLCNIRFQVKINQRIGQLLGIRSPQLIL